MFSPQLPATVLSRKQRLSLATLGAVALHCAVFVGGWFAIQQISIPANDNRVMVLTIESTQFDGLFESDVDVLETLNDAKTGAVASMPERPELSELSQLTTVPHPKATFELAPQLREVPQPELESAKHLETSEIAEQPLQSHVIEAKTPTALEPFTASDPGRPLGQRVDLDDAPDPNETPLLDLVVATQGQLKVSQSPIQTESEISQVMGSKQQRMLVKKIQQWASKLEATEYVDQSYSWQHKGQTFAAKFTHLPASGPMDLDQMIVEVTTEENGQALTTVMRLKKLAFSNFAQFVHRWDPSVMIHDDEMAGRFHSNSQILLDFDRRTRPIFHGKVTTASYKIDFESNARRNTKKEIFRGGLETGVKRINMPKPQMLFANTEGVLPEDTISFAQDTRLIFTAEGGLIVQPTAEKEAPKYQSLPSHPVYLMADDGVTLAVSGKVRGKILVYSPQRIVIENDLTYADANFAEGDDVLGLISGRDVVIAGKKVTGEGDLTVHASIYARRRFIVRDYASQRSGTLKIIGSVSAGSVSATQPRFGTNIIFDERFEELRPPGFPVTDRYELSHSDWIWSPIDEPEQ